MRRFVALVLTVSLAAACSGETSVDTTAAPATSTSPVPSTTTTTAAPETTTTTVAETTTTTARLEPPIPDTSGDDWTKIMTELYVAVGWLFENPQPGLLEVIAVPDSDYHTRLGALLQDYIDEGWRDLPDGRAEIREVALQSESGGRAVVLVVDDFDGAITVDSEGAVVAEADDRPPSGFLYTMAQDDGRWRFVSTERLGPIQGFDE